MATLLEITKEQVLSKVTIPMYFYNIILPQLPGYYDVYPVNFEYKPVVCCPLHDEDTPSCRYYPETESFYCFGCQKGGNVIQLHRYFAERMGGSPVSYRDAVYFLFDYFIKGKEETVEKIVPTVTSVATQPKDIKLSTDTEIVKFNLYRVNLEKAITFDKTIEYKVKCLIWQELDNIDVLLSLNKVNATEAEKYIKRRVKEVIK